MGGGRAVNAQTGHFRAESPRARALIESSWPRRRRLGPAAAPATGRSPRGPGAAGRLGVPHARHSEPPHPLQPLHPCCCPPFPGTEWAAGARSHPTALPHGGMGIPHPNLPSPPHSHRSTLNGPQPHGGPSGSLCWDRGWGDPPPPRPCRAGVRGRGRPESPAGGQRRLLQPEPLKCNHPPLRPRPIWLEFGPGTNGGPGASRGFREWGVKQLGPGLGGTL